MALIAVGVSLSEPGALFLRGTDSSSSWSFGNDTCGGRTCLSTSNGFLNIDSWSQNQSNLGLFQHDTTDAGEERLRSRNLLLTGFYNVSPSMDDLSLRLWEDHLAKDSHVCKKQRSSQMNWQFFCSDSTSSKLSDLGYEIVIPLNSTTQIGSLTLNTEPGRAVPGAVAFTGFFWLFVSLISYVHFKPRTVVRREISVSRDSRNKYWLFFLHVNWNLWDTVKLVSKNRRTLVWYIAYTFYSAGATAVITLAGTFFKEQLDLPSGQIGAIMLGSQVFGVPAAFVLHFLGRKSGFQVALAVVYLLYTFSVILGYFLLIDRTTPIINVWVVAASFGACIGSAIGLARSSLAGMIPVGREAEYMGLYGLSGKLLSWIGPLVFTAVNEATGNLRQAFLSLVIPFTFAFVFQIAVVMWPHDPELALEMEKRIFTVMNSEDPNTAGEEVSPQSEQFSTD
eukprot:TRINITY_DN6676_c0_g1_i1.p1 TRINITY_DN6676_c0_g1~~TRINITY_DN6676_c0_g1_i1.p1  ORF type:complete len:522 (+),score=80.25 TRINITY_DN6676_c0_g1_i1:216-1568(+)